jgi:hypothetical protein
VKSISSIVNASIRYDGMLVQAEVGRSDFFRKGKQVLQVFPTKPANMASWRDPPHVALANVQRSSRTLSPTSFTTPSQLDLKELMRFMTRYGVPASTGWREMSSGLSPVDPDEVARMQFLLKIAWRKDAVALNVVEKGFQDSGESFKYIKAKAKVEGIEWASAEPMDGPIKVVPEPYRGGMKLVFTELSSLVRWLFLADHWNDRLGICLNNNCFTPYFVLKRMGQKYCSHDCAMVIASGKYRQKRNRVIAEARANGKWPGRKR